MAKEARGAACLLSDQEQDGAIGVELLRDIRSVLGDANVIRSSDLVAKLTADPERPIAHRSSARAPGREGYRRIDFKGIGTRREKRLLRRGVLTGGSPTVPQTS